MDCETSFRQCGVTGEKTFRGRIHTAAFCSRSPSSDANRGVGGLVSIAKKGCVYLLVAQTSARGRAVLPSRLLEETKHGDEFS
jgi:hypothetical protein